MTGRASQSNRLDGGQINRDRPVSFSFNGRQLAGYAGDTLASALLANGHKMIGRSFKYHRPRGIYSAGSEEPNALVTLGRGAGREPNTRATVTELADGLEAFSQNHRGSLKYDLMAVNDLLWPFLSAGFYYKTFMWPKSFWERFYEPVIRSAAGLGRLSGEADPDNYDKGFLHCDLLVIGAGPAGLTAALAAGRSGVRVILADEDFRMGGRLNAETFEVEDIGGAAWAAGAVAELASLDNVRLMPRTTVYGAYDHFGNNDRPGIMLAGAVRAYVNRFAVAPGKQVAIFTNNDDGWHTVADLTAKGIAISAVIDTRDTTPPVNLDNTAAIIGGRVINTAGRHGIRTLTLADGRKIAADCLAVSGGWNPNVHLTCHQRGRPVWRDDIAAFAPGKDLPVGMSVAGAAAGIMTLACALKDGHKAAVVALDDLGAKLPATGAPKTDDEPASVTAFWHVAESGARAWLDLQNDVTVKDIVLARKEGFGAAEHVKRYTTLGMATDQGKTANVLALGVMAQMTGQSIADTGTTIFRPPYTPVAIAAFAGRARGNHLRPVRKTAGHDWAQEQGAIFVEAGQWLRTQWFPQAGETGWRQSVDREVNRTRASVGICDVTTLGKIDIQGIDAAEFLNRVYTNGFAKLPVGKVRYGLMLREDGLVMDDGTTARLADNHYVMTTTTANAVGVFRHMEFCCQCLWPSLDVSLVSVTEQWAQYAVAGPNSRKLLKNIIDPPCDISNDTFPFMACAEVTVCGGTLARLFRISFSGELAYELAVPARYGDALIRALMAAGKAFDAVPYGVEALGVMRIEKGHPAGGELNGHTTARDLGMGRLVSRKKDCIGNTLSERPDLCRDDRPALVGFLPVDRNASLDAGAHFVAKGQIASLETDEGWMSSTAHSPTLGHAIGLGFIRRGQERMGEIVRAVDPLRGKETEVEIVSPHFLDPDGERMRG
ncbi:MAG: 2Fe-2S iron-sulfur cluster-binding protein [Alphaproteobacteria bacterium]